MSDKKTAEEIAKTIPCQCSDCGMRESEATQMIQAYADQELASIREQLKQQEEITQDERLLIKRIWSRAYMDTEEDHIKLIKAYASNQLKQKEDENRELLDIVRATLKPINSMSEYFEIQKRAKKILDNLSA